MGWLIFIVATIGWHIGMYGMFKKAGWPAWKGLAPFLNTWTIVKELGLKKYWFFLQLIPIAGQFITIWITIKFTESFGRFNVPHHAAATFVPFAYFPYMGFSSDERFAGKVATDNYNKPASREWIDAAAFAIVAATIIRTFIFEAYTIPTSSMEKSLLVNDFLFVNKNAYGVRLPNTPLALPFMHANIVGTKNKSYLEWIKIPYTRWWGKAVQKGDAVVFNFPAGDTISREFESSKPYYDMIKEGAYILNARTGVDPTKALADTRLRLLNGEEVEMYDLSGELGNYSFDIITRPVDKRENYIKRCVATAGDVLQIKDGVLFINNEAQKLPENAATFYNVLADAKFNEEDLREKGIRISTTEKDEFTNKIGTNEYRLNLTEKEVEILKSNFKPISVERENFKKDSIIPKFSDMFPNSELSKLWTVDNFGPIWIPKKGSQIQLNDSTYQLYNRAIRVYENNKFEKTAAGKYLLNGAEIANYTFKLDYYWMMGDNRHKSQDCRFWGYVPEDHIVGKASLIWMSWENGPRWKRMFNRIK